MGSPGAYTSARRTDPAEVRDAIARGDFADARWLRCESQLAMIADVESTDKKMFMRAFIVTSDALFDAVDAIRSKTFSHDGCPIVVTDFHSITLDTCGLGVGEADS